MNFTVIIIATVVLALIGLIIGLLLGLAGKVFAVESDETIEKVRECLPGNNCGGCGYAGCDALAEAIAKGEAKPSACPVGGAAVAQKISEVMGLPADTFVRKVAFVKCSGSCDKTRFDYNYQGAESCYQVSLAPGRGPKSCAYGCLGLGSCAKACPFDAIHVVNGRAVVSREDCKACGKCVETCPHNLIELIPYDAPYMVRCFSQEKGRKVREMCDAGCIGCGICQKNCPTGAITLKNNIAHIDQSLCTGCGRCAEKCPAHVIIRQAGEADAS
ncbi:MAG TPA: RnfABCDGE type electron transport complex subunit B [Candidatus Faecivivens stercoravium]|mgnify:FL=1|uniref:Ion-translocating oxidoreductase complex subunit B n=1 Tax=Candidatus Faecivivens stercoravium TaxID=2840803 RepID=A0A9D1DWU8_9FIRM|nr:RnfABCDGE type electron transport complex subunit B [Candidatus Faecivivens stercoravium]